ncbi:MAG: MarR family transcriptional regulator, partial [Janthinobacterium sp.]
MPLAPPATLGKHDFTTLSEFRYQMRRFERFSDDVIQAHGITPLQ